MPVIDSTVSTASPAYAANREAMLALVEQLREIESRATAKSARARERFEKRGQLLPRERLPATAWTTPTPTRAYRVAA
jgi:geranyl-CoA carboxylase beta subunit